MTTVRSDTGVTVVDTVSLLLAGSESASEAEAAAVNVYVPEAEPVGLTRIVRVTTAPESSDANAPVTTPSAKARLPPRLSEAETKVRSSGIGNDAVTSVAVDGPWFLIVRVKV